MSEPRFSVIFTGETIPGADPVDVKDKLTKALKFPPEKLEQLFSGKKFVLKKNVSRDLATKLQTVFLRAGAVCIIQPLPEQTNSADAKSIRTTPHVRDLSAPACAPLGKNDSAAGLNASPRSLFAVPDHLTSKLVETLAALQTRMPIASTYIAGGLGLTILVVTIGLLFSGGVEYSDPALVRTCLVITKDIELREGTQNFLAYDAHQLLGKAADKGCINEVAQLLDLGADPNHQAYGNYYPLGLALKAGNRPLIELLQEHHAKAPQWERERAKAEQLAAQRSAKKTADQARRKAADEEIKRQEDIRAQQTLVARKKQKRQSALLEKRKSLLGCESVDFELENYDRFSSIRGARQKYRTIERGLIDAIEKRCDSTVLAWADRTEAPYHLTTNRNATFNIVLALWLWYDRPELAMQIKQSKGYTESVKPPDFDTVFMQLVRKEWAERPWDGTSEEFSKLASFLNGGMGSLLKRTTWNTAMSFAWYGGRHDLVKLFAKFSPVPAPQKLEPGLKEISFEGTSYSDLSSHPAYECQENDSKYSYCVLENGNRRTIYSSVAGVSAARSAVISFIDHKVARIEVYMVLGRGSDGRHLSIPIADAVTTKYGTAPRIETSKKQGSSRDYVVKEYHWNMPGINLSLLQGRKVGTQNALEVFGMSSRAAKQFAGFRSDVKRDILVVSHPERAKILDAYEKKKREEKLAQRRAEVEEARKQKALKRKKNLKDI